MISTKGVTRYSVTIQYHPPHTSRLGKRGTRPRRHCVFIADSVGATAFVKFYKAVFKHIEQMK